MTAEWARGNWPKILATVVDPRFLNGKHHPCPRGEGKDRFRFSDRNGTGAYFCACSDGGKDGFDLIRCIKGGSFKDACRVVEKAIGPEPRDGDAKPKRQVRTWAESLRREVKKIRRSAYLEGRGLVTPPGLDWHPRLGYYAEGKRVAEYPAMLAPIINDGKFFTYHATYLDNGAKAPVDPCRKILPGHRSLEGGAVPLWPWESGPLGVAEGVETAIAAHVLHGGMPVWACLGTSLMKTWRPISAVKEVVIYADRDENLAGHAAAYTLAHRLLRMGLEVRIEIPPMVGDWADMV